MAAWNWHPLTGMADAIVDLVSTGSTLKANHLIEVERIMDISSRLVVNQASLKLKTAAFGILIETFDRATPKRLEACRPTPPFTTHADSPIATAMTARPLRLSTAQADFETQFQQRLHWSADTDAAIEQRVADILADVKLRGDAAVLEYTARFDGLQADSMAALELTQAELKAAFESLPTAQKTALQDAAARVRSYHEAQKKACGESWQYRDADGSLLGQKVTPLDRVGIYVPGGKAAYPSSVLMNAIPAHVAGVQEIIMVVPTPAKDRSGANASRGEKNPLGVGRCLCGGRQPRLHHRRRAGRGRAGLRHRHRARGRQNHRPRQCLCGRCQAPRVWHGGHRHDCWSV
jgi:hypothetical protein